LTEQLLDRIEAAIFGILRELGHDPDTSYVRNVMARHLAAHADPTSPKQTVMVPPEDAPRNDAPRPVMF
jgi:hypothetical protein